jgi:hypothetical protein
MQDNHIISSELTSLEAANLFISDEEIFEDICANIRQELSPDSISESILVDDFIYHQAMVSFLRQSKASMLAHAKIKAAEQIFRTYGEWSFDYLSDELKDKAKNLVKGEKRAVKDYHNIIKSNDFPVDFLQHIAYQIQLKHMGEYDKAIFHHADLRNRALLTLEKTKTLIAERAKYLASHDEAA